jgi:peptidoglycan/LPS O-acetylase OafA/YrhL
MTVTPPRTAIRRFPALDGLRALAVLAVVTTHVAFYTGRYERGVGSAVLARLDVGVAVFFVISGFLLVQPWFRAAAVGGARPSVRVYAVRRVARIMPAYLAAVVLALLTLPANAGTPAVEWLRQVLLLQNYGAGHLREGLTQMWSLGTEVAFYALLPVIGAGVMRLCRNTWRPRALAALLGVGALVPVAWHLLLDDEGGDRWASGGLWLPAFLGWFCAGMALALLRVQVDVVGAAPSSRWRRVDALGRYPFTWWALAAAVLLVASTPVAGPRLLEPATSWEAVTKSLLYLVVATAVVAPAVLTESPLTTSLLGNRFMGFAGDISYGVFLYHLVVLGWVVSALDLPVFTGSVVLVLPLTLGVTVLIATASRAFLEEPVLRRAHRVRPRKVTVGEGPTTAGE